MKKLLSVLLSVLMVLTLSIPAFAAEGDDSTPTVVRIPEGTKVVTSSTLDDSVIERLRVKTIYVPSSVTTIKEGSLTGYANVENVYVENSKDNITIESGALPTGTNVVYSEKPTATTTTTKKQETTTTTKAETTTKKEDSEDKTTTKKSDSDNKTTTKKSESTTKKSDKTTKKSDKTTKKTTVSSAPTTSDPKKRTTVKNKPLTIKSTKASKTTAGAGPLIPEVEVDPDTIVEEPDPNMEGNVTTVTFAGEAITDKDGTIIGFEETKGGTSDTSDNRTGVVAAATGVGVVGLSAIAFIIFKLRRRP